MAEALALVRRDLGTSAVVLHTRTFSQGGFLGIGAKQIVEITAAHRKDVGRETRPSPARPPRTQPKPDRARSVPTPEPMAGDLIRRTYAAAAAELNRKNPPPADRPLRTPAASPPPAPPAPTAEPLADEMRAVKRMVQLMMRRQNEQGPTKPSHGMTDTLFDQYVSLIEREVAEELAEEVIDKVRQLLDADQMQDEARVRATVLKVLAKQIPTDAGAGKLEPTADGRPRTIALIGPTGVGKTTTIAKLAATFKLKLGEEVGLITMDTYRIAAVDQLQTYANIIGVPLHVVSRPDEMARAIRRCAGCGVILIDTAGRSQRDDASLDQLKEMVAAADPHEVHLVLSSTCSQPVLLDTVERFSKIPTDRIIFTKLDEAISFGVLLNVTRKVNKRLSYVTTGQEVPHKITPGRSAKLAALVMGDQNTS